MDAEGRNRYLLQGSRKLFIGSSRTRAGLRGICPICPTCGERWAVLDLGGEPSSEFTVARWPCERHGTPYFTGGSAWKLLIWWDSGLPPALRPAMQFFSPEFLAREIRLKAAQLLGEVSEADL